jgi:hypothetical protein
LQGLLIVTMSLRRIKISRPGFFILGNPNSLSPKKKREHDNAWRQRQHDTKNDRLNCSHRSPRPFDSANLLLARSACIVGFPHVNRNARPPGLVRSQPVGWVERLRNPSLGTELTVKRKLSPARTLQRSSTRSPFYHGHAMGIAALHPSCGLGHGSNGGLPRKPFARNCRCSTRSPVRSSAIEYAEIERTLWGNLRCFARSSRGGNNRRISSCEPQFSP